MHCAAIRTHINGLHLYSVSRANDLGRFSWLGAGIHLQRQHHVAAHLHMHVTSQQEGVSVRRCFFVASSGVGRFAWWCTRKVARLQKKLHRCPIGNNHEVQLHILHDYIPGCLLNPFLVRAYSVAIKHTHKHDALQKLLTGMCRLLFS
jgi:hypothetical protein